MDEKFPNEFYESNPAHIYESYVAFLRLKFNENPNIKIAEDITSTSISDKFSNGEYQSHEDSIYRIYHDIKLVCFILIHYYSQGTRSYQMVDKFYKFASELILRECFRVGVKLVGDPEIGSELKESDFSKTISNDFFKISQIYQLSVAETYHTQNKEGHLFSSVITRSTLDQRPREVPHEECKVVKIIPQATSQPANRLGFVAANTSNVPDPTISPTEIMTSFLHPNWYPLPTTKWLQYGHHQSFAPSISEFKSVTDCSRKGEIWLEKVGYKKWYDAVSKKESKSTQQENVNSSKSDLKSSDQNMSPEEKEKEDNVVTDEEVESNEPEDEVIVTTDPAGPVNIKLKNLYEWKPNHQVHDDDIKAFEEGKQQQLLTDILLKLKSYKSKRVKLNKISKPTSKEISLYHRAQNILKEAILSQQVRMCPKLYDSNFPVLQNNYAGSIPVVKTISTRKKKTKKSLQ